MWFFGHASLGYLITKVILRRETPNKTVILTGILAGMLPDADVIFLFWDRQAFLTYHRAFSHSLVFCLISAMILYMIFCSSCSVKGFQALFGAEISHLIADLLTDSYYPHGIALLWPFSDNLFSFKVLDEIFGFGFITSESGSFLFSIITSIVALLAWIYLRKEKD